MPQGGEVQGRVVGASAPRIVAEDDLEALVETVLDPPVLADGPVHPRGVGRQAAEVEPVFDAGLTLDRALGGDNSERLEIPPALRSVQAVQWAEDWAAPELNNFFSVNSRTAI